MHFLPQQSANFRAHRRDWFHQRRDRFLRRLLEDFFDLYEDFVEYYTLSLASGCFGADSGTFFLDESCAAMREQLWQRLKRMVGSENDKGMLWQLKDLCHLIWPEEKARGDVNGSLVDWQTASLFHEAMKLKENIYMLNRYGPAILRAHGAAGDRFSGNSALTPHSGLSRIMDMEQLFIRIRADVSRQMDLLGVLFGQICYLLRMMVQDLAGNMLVVRLLIEKQDQVSRVWGEDIAELLADIFDNDSAAGFCAAGRSYMQGQWYDQAIRMYQRAFALNSDCDEARIKVAQLKAILGNTCS